MDARTRRAYASRSTAWLWVVAPACMAALQAWYFYLGDVAEGHPSPSLLRPVVAEFTGVYAAALLIYLWLPLFDRFPFEAGRWRRSLTVHVPAALFFSR